MYVRDLTLQQPFRYSGSKTKLLSKCDFYFPDNLRVVEPFMGAANFAVSTGFKWYGYESNQELVNMVEWLQTVSPQGLQRLRDDYEGKRVSIKELDLRAEAKTYLRINISGVYVGQLSSWLIYEQHKLPIEKTLAAQENLRKGTIICGDYKESLELVSRRDDLLFFVDPPYLGTSPNYNKKNSGFKAGELSRFLQHLTSLHIRWIFTYGTEAPILFPEYVWYPVYERKVPTIHAKGGGTQIRTEYIAFNYEADFRRNDA